MTATVTRIHPGRPPAAPAPTHTCQPGECVPVREYWGADGEVHLMACQICGTPMPEAGR